MRVPKKAWGMALAVAAAAVVLLFLKQPKALEYTLADGSVLRVEKVSFGKQEDFKVGGRVRVVRGWTMDWLAKIWPGRFKSPAGNYSRWNDDGNEPHTNTDALQIWVTRRNMITGKYLDVSEFGSGFQTAQLADEHGCPFMAAHAGGYEDGLLGGSNGFSVGWFTFEAFPRREKNFQFLLRNNRTKSEADFTIPNPVSTRGRVNWVAEPLPITRRDGDLAFTLTGIKLGTIPVYSVTPSFEMRERDQLTKEWQLADMELYDESGNFVSKNSPPYSFYLCPWEPTWKLVARFFGSEQSALASNFVWTISGVKVPGEGEFVALNATNEVQGVAMKAIALAGAGNVTYSNDAVVQALPLKGGERGNSMSASSDGGTNYSIDIRSTRPHVTLEIGQLPKNQQLTLRATDDQGRQIYAQEYNTQITSQKEIHYLTKLDSRVPNILTLNLSKDAKTVDLSFCIHNARIEEFIFKPPTPEKH